MGKKKHVCFFKKPNEITSNKRAFHTVEFIIQCNTTQKYLDLRYVLNRVRKRSVTDKSRGYELIL